MELLTLQTSVEALAGDAASAAEPAAPGTAAALQNVNDAAAEDFTDPALSLLSASNIDALSSIATGTTNALVGIAGDVVQDTLATNFDSAETSTALGAPLHGSITQSQAAVAGGGSDYDTNPTSVASYHDAHEGYANASNADMQGSSSGLPAHVHALAAAGPSSTAVACGAAEQGRETPVSH